MKYLGYAICFCFEEDGVEWSAWTNEAGVLVTQEEPEKVSFQYDDWYKFETKFPEMAVIIRGEMKKKMEETLKVLQEAQ